MVKLVAVNVPVLVCAGFLRHGWNVENGMDCIGKPNRLVASVSIIVSLSLVNKEATRTSRSITLAYSVTCIFGAIAGVLRDKYHLDEDGRVTPHTHDDAVDPHWSAVLMYMLIDTGMFIFRLAIAHSVTIYSSQPSPPTLFAGYASLLKFRPAVNAKDLWPVILSALVVVIFNLPARTAELHSPWHGRVRELLARTTLQEDITWWLAGCASCFLLVVVMTLHPQIKKSDNPSGPSALTSRTVRGVRCESRLQWVRSWLQSLVSEDAEATTDDLVRTITDDRPPMADGVNTASSGACTGPAVEVAATQPEGAPTDPNSSPVQEGTPTAMVSSPRTPSRGESPEMAVAFPKTGIACQMSAASFAASLRVGSMGSKEGRPRDQNRHHQD